MSVNNEPYTLHREGATLYVLNKNGTNAFSMSIQAGFDDNGERLTQKQCENIARIIDFAILFTQSQCTIELNIDKIIKSE